MTTQALICSEGCPHVPHDSGCSVRRSDHLDRVARELAVEALLGQRDTARAEAERERRIAAAFKGWRGREVVEARENLTQQINALTVERDALRAEVDARISVRALVGLTPSEHDDVPRWSVNDIRAAIGGAA